MRDRKSRNAVWMISHATALWFGVFRAVIDRNSDSVRFGIAMKTN